MSQPGASGKIAGQNLNGKNCFFVVSAVGRWNDLLMREFHIINAAEGSLCIIYRLHMCKYLNTYV